MDDVKSSYRISERPNELIDRSKPIQFTFEGRAYGAFVGDTIASALAANGVRMVARSFKYHRPRGLRAHGHSTDAMVQIGERVSESMWLVQVEDGMVVTSAQTAPMYEDRPLSMVEQLDRDGSIGVRYKTLIHPRSEWNAREQLMREGAGLGELDEASDVDSGYSKRYLHADVAVVGAGPAGMRAALSAADAGATVILFDENRFLGGHLAINGLSATQCPGLIEGVQAHSRVDVRLNALVSGVFEDGWLFVTQGQQLLKVRAGATVFATGAEDQPQIFANNDLPGVMLGSAVARLLHRYGVAPGGSTLIATANEDGWQLAAALHAVGVRVTVADERASGGVLSERAIAAGVMVHWRCVIQAATGNDAVDGYQLKQLDTGTIREGACSCIALCTGWAPRYDLPYLAGCKFSYDDARHEFLPSHAAANCFLAGRVTGVHSFDAELLQAELAGKSAAHAAGIGEAPDANLVARVAAAESAQTPRTSSIYRTEGTGKQFVDFDKDVTVTDVRDAVTESFNSVELLKRYTKISTGPSQGKWSSAATIRLLADLNGETVAQTGKTTSRAPARPIKLRHLAGQMLEPVRYTPVHHWHVAHGAEMMEAGLWMRPRDYGDVSAEISTVRSSVGIIDVSTLGKIKLTGPGVPALLDKLYINSFSKLKVGRVRYGIMCNSEGVIIDDGVTARVAENEWYMSTTSGGAGSVYEWIQWWVQSGWGDGVHVTSVTEGRAAFNVTGPRARDLLSQLTDADLSNSAFPYMRSRDIAISGVDCRVLRIGFTGELSYEVHAPSSQSLHVWEAIMAAGEQYGIKPFGMEAQRVLRLEKGHIIVGHDTDPLTNPLMANQAWAVKLNKDDFLGKRLIWRASERGVKQKLVGFKMVTPDVVPEEGLQIVKQVEPSPSYPIGLRIIGWIASCKFSPTLGEVIGLCWLPTELAEQVGQAFSIRRNGELIDAATHHGAFYDVDGQRLRS